MDGFACSSWYFLRFVSPHYDAAPFDPAALAAWGRPDLYVGGAEHAVMHLLYARMWTRVIADAGLIGFREPFPVLRNQGVMHGRDGNGETRRMSKSSGNVVTPDERGREMGRRQPAAAPAVHGAVRPSHELGRGRAEGEPPLPGAGLAAGAPGRAGKEPGAGPGRTRRGERCDTACVV